MTDKHPPRPLVAHAQAIGSTRRRSAPQAETTSDERRFIGVGLATVIGGLASLAAVMATVEPQTLQSPGPLTRPHVQASLTCASCHQSTEGQPRPPGQACVGCHGPHPSARPGHRAMFERGALTCTSCHRVHRDMGGVAWPGEGDPLRYGPGAEVVVPVDTAPGRTGGAWVVPVIPADVCSDCHRVAADDDPIRRCLVGSQASLSPADRPTTCFDEHRRLDGLTIQDDAVRTRLSAWNVAREVVARSPVAPSETPEPAPAWTWLAAGVGAGGISWGGARLVSGLRRRRRRPSASNAAPEVPAVKRLPVVDTATCIGCSACVDACPYDVLAMEHYVAKVVRPDDCCGLTLCEQRCPNGSLVVTEGEPIEDRPGIDETLQSSDVPGLYLAGDLTGLPLIRNAVDQGALAVQAVQAGLPRGHGAQLDVVIIGAGPAGLSAGLAAATAGLRYRVLEQGGVAESIRSFPRGKLVLDQSVGRPQIGQLWVGETTKEDLVGKWMRTVRQHQLAVAEHHRVTAVARQPDGTFAVSAVHEQGETTMTAARVILAIGRRGSPRKLPIALPDAVLDRVHYSLADARSFAGQRVVVVGLGDVAMEAAVALSRQPGTSVTVVHRKDDFSRGKQRNIDELKRRVAAGRVTMAWSSEVAEVAVGGVTLRGPGGSHTVSWDAMFVMIGAIAPWDFLQRIGIRRIADARDAMRKTEVFWLFERSGLPSRPPGS